MYNINVFLPKNWMGHNQEYQMKFKFLKSAFISLALSVSYYSNASIISTGFDGTIDCNGCGNFFNISIKSSDVTFESLEVNIEAGITDVLVYMKNGSYIGSESNSSDWNLFSTTTVEGLGIGVGTFVDITDFTLLANMSYAMYIMQTAGVNFYDSTSKAIANDDLSLDLGKSGINNFSNTIYNPRAWNGTINYSVEVPEPSTLAIFALGLMSLATRRFKKQS